MILQQAELIITANQRQALDVQRQYRLPSTRVMAWPTFIEQLWQQWSASQTAHTWHWLTGFEQQLLWQRLLQDDGRDSQQHALSHSCMDAWQWLTTWRVPLSALLTFATANSEWFYRIAQRYQQQCRDKAWLDAAVAIDQLLAEPLWLQTALPARVVFYHFWQMTPQLTHFQQVLREVDIDVVIVDSESPTKAQQWRWVADSTETEMRDMVQWLAEQASLHPQDRFACVISDLSGRRATLETCLQRHLPPALLSQVHFSIGKPLAEYPLLSVMEALLTVAYQRDVPLADLSYLSHSPFWSHAALMEVLISQWRSTQWAALPQEAWASMADDVLYTWWRELKQFDHSKALPSLWCVRFQQILTHSGWPAVELSRDEQAVFAQLTLAYQRFAALDAFLGELTAAAALRYWRDSLQHSIFEPPSAVTPRLFFMGVFETLGSHFDHVWLMDAVFAQWPTLPAANALIPFACQKHYHLPNASNRPAQEQVLWQALSHTGRHWIVSHAAWHNGEARAGLSQVASWPLLPWQVPAMVVEPDEIVWLQHEESHGVPCQDPYAPGGTAALKAQAHCPFQAYARYRLGLRALTPAESSLTAVERGLMVHAALFASWQAIDSQHNLQALSDEALQAIIARSARLALAELSAWRRRLLPKTLLKLEQQRLQRLLKSWLHLEAQRPAFRVEQIEKGSEVSFAGRLWRFKPDRIDVLDNGDRLLIDYKTGAAPISWQADPLLEPQLPFYAVLSPKPIAALVIAQVTAKGQKMLGLAANLLDCGPLGQVVGVEDWAAQCQHWYTAIERLAVDYLAGQAAVNPVKGSTTCRSCDLASVCRVKAALAKGLNS